MKLISSNKRCSILEVNADELAAQFTLIDLPIFKSIKRNELTNLGKSTKRQELSPNVVAMNRQFNQVSFWVVGQILAHDLPRPRAELISHFIKTAKQLYLLNNLHSSYAVVSALLSSPIYRLEKTWHYIRKKWPKEKQLLDKLTELYSDNNNYEKLRDHLANCNLPCIPYLGMYSRDIIYTNEAHQEGTIQRTKNTSKVLESIEKFQSSHYDHLVHNPTIASSLLSSRYIDELQKFVEDENYKRSLELEPQESNIDNNNSLESVIGPCQPTVNNNGNPRPYRKSAILLASLSSLVQSAVITTSNKFGGSSPRRLSSDSQKTYKYLIDDSFIDHHTHPHHDNHHHTHHTSFPPPISTSN